MPTDLAVAMMRNSALCDPFEWLPAGCGITATYSRKSYIKRALCLVFLGRPLIKYSESFRSGSDCAQCLGIATRGAIAGPGLLLAAADANSRGYAAD
jgi:hypothetical protein